MFENIFQIRLCCKNMEERKVEGRTGKEETSRRVDADERSRITDREDEKNVERVNVWDTLRYYLDGFRYYHYVVAEKVNKVIGLVCLAIIKLYFFLMGLDRYIDIDDDETEDAGL
ncbi:uncharacterized protein LOC724900 isoform X3 [Apis mellifera]|uniref:Uncharacterized protein LOC724900 isoform X3 n=1 Tax=Apis mellifera TaxID=7460 RepID=A0A7M7GYC6_APIME|nr:uncharacterized protein LOC724900 isoform X3 [Apis mellifera]|eukprot:XP_006569270.1 uncharacterized protein LOC724900 isoform X3 [Apis mellifera]